VPIRLAPCGWPHRPSRNHGFWHPDYLRRKLDKLRRAAMPNLHRRRLGAAETPGPEDFHDVPARSYFFQGKLEPRQVLAVLELIPPHSSLSHKGEGVWW